MRSLQELLKEATPAPWFVSRPVGRDTQWLDIVDSNGDEIMSAPTMPNLSAVHLDCVEEQRAETQRHITNLELVAALRNNAAETPEAADLQRQKAEAFDWLVEHAHGCEYELQGLKPPGTWQIRWWHREQQRYRVLNGFLTLLEAINAARESEGKK